MCLSRESCVSRPPGVFVVSLNPVTPSLTACGERDALGTSCGCTMYERTLSRIPI